MGEPTQEEPLAEEQEDEPPLERDCIRWIVLGLTCMVMTGAFYSLDIPASLHEEMKEYMPATDFEMKFNLLYSVYSFPNVILPFFGGGLVDSYGSSLMLVVFGSLCLLGQGFFAVGGVYRSWGVMLAGRTLYGFGGESLCAAYSTLLAEWFAGKELALSFGIALAVARLGSVLNNLVSPTVANHFSTPWALWVGLMMNTMSVAMALLLYTIDSKHKAEQLETERLAVAVNEEEEEQQAHDNLIEPLLETNSESTASMIDSDSRRGVRSFGVLFWLLSVSCLVVYACILPWNNVASGILLERDFFRPATDDCQLVYPDQCSSGLYQNHSNPSVNVNTSETCPGDRYAPVLPQSLNVTSNGRIVYQNGHVTSNDVDCEDSFWANGCTRDYCHALESATETAGRVMSIPYTLAACLAPLIGRLIDKFGRRGFLALIASCVLVLVHLSLALTRLAPAIPLLGQGLAYALYSSVLWPSVTLTVRKESTGKAFGVITSIQNIGLALCPIFVATVFEISGRFIPSVELFFTACAVAGSIVGTVLVVVDLRQGGRLNSVSGFGEEAFEGPDYLDSDDECQSGIISISY